MSPIGREQQSIDFFREKIKALRKLLKEVHTCLLKIYEIL